MRTVGSHAELTLKAIRSAAVSLFAERGYQAVTLRMLAQAIGIQAGSLYNHMDNKQELLGRILREIMQDLLASMEDALKDVVEPLQRLRVFVKVHIDYHTKHKDEVFIGNMELRNLTPDNYVRVVSLRDRYERLLSAILDLGHERKVFMIQDVKLVEFSILAMLSNVAAWYHPEGRLSQDQLVEQYTALVERLLDVRQDGLVSTASLPLRKRRSA